MAEEQRWETVMFYNGL